MRHVTLRAIAILDGLDTTHVPTDINACGKPAVYSQDIPHFTSFDAVEIQQALTLPASLLDDTHLSAVQRLREIDCPTCRVMLDQAMESKHHT
jgi:hypothetical protein